MKYALILFVLSMPAYANVAKYSAPSDKESSTGMVYDKDGHGYDNADTVRTGQSATKREYQIDSSRSCRDANGTWLRSGDIGYAACLDNSNTMKK